MKDHFDGLIDHLLNAGFFLEQAVEILEQGMIERVLQRTEGNRSEAARILGIHRNTLLRKMTTYRIDGDGLKGKPPGRAGGRGLRKAHVAS